MNQNRDRWPSQLMFIFAVIGSAVGLGNVWRFPYLVGKYGGGAFLLPYIIVLFLIGFPLMVLEFAVGQKMQQGAVGSLSKIDKRLSGIGLGSILTSFGVCSYYAVIMGWTLIYLFYSINLNWGDDTKSFFFNQVLQASPDASIIEGFSMPVLTGLFLAWVCVYFSIWKGVKSVSNVIKLTMPLPVLLLFILLIRSLYLPGAINGIFYYFKPDFGAMYDLELWMAAITQTFFTLTLGFGVMITYASYRPKDCDIVKHALIATFSDITIALLGGFVIFATLGHMAYNNGQNISDLAATGPSLAFIVFPKTLSSIPGATFFAILFFLMLATLAVDSLFSLVEAIATFIEDYFTTIKKEMIVFFVCLLCFICGLVFTTSAGIYYLDIADHFITNYGLVLVGLLQTIAIGWFYGAEKLRKYVNDVSNSQISIFFDFSIKYCIPCLLTLVLVHSAYTDLTKSYENYPDWAIWSFGWGAVGCFILICFSFSLYQSRRT